MKEKKARLKARRRHQWIIALLTAGVMINFVAGQVVDHKLNQFHDNNRTLLGLLSLNDKIVELKNDIINLEARMQESMSVMSGKAEVEVQVVKTHNDIKHITAALHQFDRYDSLADSLDYQVNKMISQAQHVMKVPLASGSTLLSTDSEWMSLREDIFLLAEEVSASVREDIMALQEMLSIQGTRTSLIDRIVPYMSDVFFAVLAVLLVGNLRMYDRLYESLRMVILTKQLACEEKNHLVANLSHDTRTPLNSILGYVNLLRKTSLTATQHQYTEAIRASARDLLNVVTDFLDLSWLDEGMLTLRKGPVNIHEITEQLNSIYKGAFKNKNLGFSIITDADVLHPLQGDGHKLKQILYHLINRALTSTEHGYVSVYINHTRITPRNVVVQFRIVDTGPGIPNEHLPYIFERFYPVSVKSSEKNTGISLGLSIARQFTELMGGRIIVNSEPDKGTEFVVELPFERADEQTDTDSTLLFTPSMQLQAGMGKKHKILIVDNDRRNGELTVEVLKGWNHDTTLVHNGREAIEALTTQFYHLVVTDIRMVDMDGYTLARKIRQELKSSVPIIALTAHAELHVREKCLDAGMNDCVVKPFNELELFGVLMKFIPLKPDLIAHGFRNLKTTSNRTQKLE